MNQEMHDLAQWSIPTVKAAGTNDCRVGIQSQRFVEISYRKRKPENIRHTEIILAGPPLRVDQAG